jgi:NADPH-dependent 2,4-dienoyl-CoA reductase/sulfur reductase-like enzyme
VLSGYRSLQQLSHDYKDLGRNYDIRTLQAEVKAIDAQQQYVMLHDGVKLEYDRLVIAPGVDFSYDSLPMLASEQAQQRVPHAWKAGPQTQLLQQQLWAMKPGGTVVIAVPQTPYRCPPGPYERACQIASYLKRHNPRGKVIVLDANGDIVSKKALFTHSWETYYSGLIEYHPSSAIDSLDVQKLSVETVFDSYQADVLNVIPPQQAGKVAELAGVINVDGRWCDVDFISYESTAVSNVHVIGDAVAAKMPKSAHMANAQAKICAAAIVALLREQTPEAEPVFNNTCYSFIDDNIAGHVAAVYRYNSKEKSMEAMPGGGATKIATAEEGRFAEAWAHNIWADTLE